MLEIEDNVFYVLEIEDKKYLFKTQKGAVDTLKEKGKSEEIDSEKLNVLEINTSGEKWEVKGIPWSKIALQLIQEE